MTDELRTGSLSVSNDSHRFLSGLVSSEETTADAPFSSIIEAFRFAFALGLSRGEKRKRVGGSADVAPRQFTVADYLDILESEARESDVSLGGLVSDYAEAGAWIMKERIEEGRSVLSLLDAIVDQ